MRRRLDLAMTLVGDPRIIFLDEPTTGLDPRSRRVMWDIVRDLVADGVTIFLTTQYLEEADRLAARVALLDRGSDRRPGHAGRAQAPRPGRHVRLGFGDVAELDRAARCSAAVRATRRARPPAPERRRGRLAAARCSTGSMPGSIDVAGLSVRTADLDDVFLSLTGRRRRHGGSHAMTADVITDSATMLRRSLRRMRRYPSLTFFIAAIPVVVLLLFVYVFGGTLGAGLGHAPAGLPAGADARPTSRMSCPGSC